MDGAFNEKVNNHRNKAKELEEYAKKVKINFIYLNIRLWNEKKEKPSFYLRRKNEYKG